jgi:hypothetical protein
MKLPNPAVTSHVTKAAIDIGLPSSVRTSDYRMMN